MSVINWTPYKESCVEMAIKHGITATELSPQLGISIDSICRKAIAMGLKFPNQGRRNAIKGKKNELNSWKTCIAIKKHKPKYNRKPLPQKQREMVLNYKLNHLNKCGDCVIEVESWSNEREFLWNGRIVGLQDIENRFEEKRVA